MGSTNKGTEKQKAKREISMEMNHMEMNHREMNHRENMSVEMESRSCNEQFARVVVAVFLSRLDPMVEELDDVKTAVSEAVTNCIIHGYEGKEGTIRLEVAMEGREATIRVIDYGVGISDVKKAMEPLFTTKPSEERSGMGFCFMEAFMDELEVTSHPGEGTIVTMKKVFQEVRKGEAEEKQALDRMQNGDIK